MSTRSHQSPMFNRCEPMWYSNSMKFQETCDTLGVVAFLVTCSAIPTPSLILGLRARDMIVSDT